MVRLHAERHRDTEYVEPCTRPTFEEDRSGIVRDDKLLDGKLDRIVSDSLH